MGACESCQERKTNQTSELVPNKPKEPLKLLIVGARGLGGRNWFPENAVSVFCALSVKEKPGQGVIYKTKRVRDSPAPRWAEEVTISDYELGDTLQFEVLEAQDGLAETLGRVSLNYERFRTHGFNGELEVGMVSDDVRAFLKVKVRMSQDNYPEGMPEEFVVTLDNKPQKVLGIDYDMQDGTTVHITGMRPGAIRTYNENVKPAFQVQPGDYIMEVNSVKGSAGKILEALRREARLEMRVRRAEELHVALFIPDEEDPGPKGRGKRGGAKCSCGPSLDSRRKHVLGMDFPNNPVGTSLVITKVNEGGPMEEWNNAYPHQQVKGGDRIVAVNRDKANADTLLKRMQAASEKVQLTILRPVVLDSEMPGTEPIGFRQDSMA